MKTWLADLIVIIENIIAALWPAWGLRRQRRKFKNRIRQLKK